jgi:predicted ABC-type ATPase
MARKRAKPRCIIIAGPNGSGKTTFARDYLPGIAGLIHFINADLIAGGISPLRPTLAALTAGRLNFQNVYQALAKVVAKDPNDKGW